MKITYKEFLKESISDKTTAEKILDTAERDGYLSGMETSANYVVSAAKKVAKDFDDLRNDEERKVFRDTYYKKFLKLIHKI